ncbi:MAG: hypothetical protein IJR69_02440 [Bacteroidaceae bacterium]|nr:hypothetical protein [Bacteroidaceae bacterium]
MSTATLTNLRDYLYGTLTPANMIWLADQLTKYAKKETEEDFPLKRYTKEEINAMLDEAEAEIAAGMGTPDEEAWDEWDGEMARLEQKDLELAEAV